jgi:phosphoglycerate dehydrogenase-like enzyme
MPNMSSMRKMVLMDRPQAIGTLPYFLAESHKSTDVRDRLDEIRAAAPGFEIEYFDESPSLLESSIGDAEVIATIGLGPDALSVAKRLKWLHIWSAGVEHTTYPELISSPVVITCIKGNAGVPMAEFAMMHIYTWTKKLLQYLAAHERKEWSTGGHGELINKTVGIIGLGNSGADLARKCKAAHMRVLGLRRTTTPCEYVDEMYTRDRLHEFLGEADFVCITAARTPETLGMLGEAEFRAMKPTAYLIVTSRGGIAQDGALLEALNQRWIAGASLDAHTTEPLPADSPFWSAPNTIITPHSAAGGTGNAARAMDIFMDHLNRYVRGEPFKNQVDKAAGY